MPKQRSKTFVIGKKVKVDFYLSPAGQCPAEKFLNGLEKIHRAKISAIISGFADNAKTSNPDMHKKLKGKKASGFEEFIDEKISKTRFFFFYAGTNHIVITHGTHKKRNDTDQTEIDRMISIKKSYENRELYEG